MPALRVARVLDLVVIRVAETCSWLVLGVVVILFAQWPVRDLLVGTGAIHGRPQVYLNDYGQLMHAAVFLVGIAYALATDRHVRFDVFRSRFSSRVTAMVELGGHVLVVLPWVGVLAYFGADVVSRSLTTGETFPDTGSPGYPLMRVAFVLCLVLVALASAARIALSLHDLFEPGPRHGIDVIAPEG